jgi:hypothetical protein
MLISRKFYYSLLWKPNAFLGFTSKSSCCAYEKLRRWEINTITTLQSKRGKEITERHDGTGSLVLDLPTLHQVVFPGSLNEFFFFFTALEIAHRRDG